jgi:malate/lactate dehydrogenase
MSVPVLVGRQGVAKILHYDFTAEEAAAFARSEAHLRGLLALTQEV